MFESLVHIKWKCMMCIKTSKENNVSWYVSNVVLWNFLHILFHWQRNPISRVTQTSVIIKTLFNGATISILPVQTEALKLAKYHAMYAYVLIDIRRKSYNIIHVWYIIESKCWKLYRINKLCFNESYPHDHIRFLYIKASSTHIKSHGHK